MKKSKKQEVKLSEAEISLNHVKDGYFIPEPTIIYKVGDKVKRGNIKSSTVIDVIENGKILKLFEICTDNNYGRPYDYERENYCVWTDVSPVFETYPESFIKNDNLRLSFSQRTIDGLITTYYYFGIDTKPDYQRDYVWTIDDKINLIDSIFKNIEIGKFVLVHLPYKENSPSYEILDGKQRLNAIIEFYEGKFEYNGYKFRELSPKDIQYFENFSISWADIRENITEKEKLEYFYRLNKFGKVMDNKHLQKIEDKIKKL